MKIKLKKDKYTRARKGNSKLLKISCSSCNTFLFNYQKDGIGSLQRVYYDRIINYETKNKLECPNCGQLIGTPMIYEPENRPAFRLIRGKFSKKLV